VSVKRAFGKHLKKMRQAEGLTQYKLSELVGVSDDRTVRAWESGEDLPTAENLEKLCNVLHVTIRDLFDFDYP
jgi:transcriptional regulator with XRE-family HTH domain